MKHTIIKPAETLANVTCDVCGRSTEVKGYGHQFGTLQAHWGYGSHHDGERYEVHLCEACFFSTLGNLRRERMVNTMFDDKESDPDDDFGLVHRGEYRSNS